MTDIRRASGVFLFSAAFLLLELSLSRIFSVISFYHYAYLAISIALFGTALGGVLVYLKPSLFPKGKTDEQLAVLCALYAAFAVVSMNLISNLNFDPFQPFGETFADLWWLILLGTIPFLIAGVFLARVFEQNRERIGYIYGANLIGSGIGCLLVIPAMNILGGPGSVIFAAFLSALAAIALQPVAGKARTRGYAVLAVILLVLCIINPSIGYIKLRYSKGKNLENANVRYSGWNSFSRILVIEDYPQFLAFETEARNLLNPKDAFRFYNWSLSSAYEGPEVEGLSLLIDDLAGSPLISFDGDLTKVDFLRYDITSLGYYLKEGDSPDVLIIGPGGGRDVLTALNFGAGKITGVELNPLIIDVTQNQFGDFTGRPYSQPGVTIHKDEGRNFIAGSKEKFDIIQIPLVDTWAATTSGAFSLSENNLYTVEAFEEYFDHLKPGGILAVSRYVFDPPKQSLRVLSLFREYCERNGISDPERKCAVVAFDEYIYYNVGTIIMKLEDLTAEEMDILGKTSEEMGYKILWMPDGGFYPDQFTELLRTDDFDKFLEDYPFDISPTTDDKPFFFHMVRPHEFVKALVVSDQSGQPYNFMAIFTLMALLLLLLILTVVGIIAPLLIKLQKEKIVLGPILSGQLVYFAFLGAAFMLFEIATIQKFILFLGHPVYALSVVIFSLLVFTGIGAWFSDRLAMRKDYSGPGKFIFILCGVILTFTFLLSPLFNALIGRHIFVRCLIAVLLLAPLGLLLGLPFPLGIRMLGPSGSRLIPYAYGINGAFSVLGSVTALVLALAYGLSFNLYIAIGLYLLAALLSMQGRKRVNQA